MTKIQNLTTNIMYDFILLQTLIQTFHITAFQNNSGDDDDELSMFRQQWQRELEATPSQNITPKKNAHNKTENVASVIADLPKEAQEHECSDFRKVLKFISFYFACTNTP